MVRMVHGTWYMVRRVHGTYTAYVQGVAAHLWAWGKLPCASGTYCTARRWAVHVARTCSTEAPGRTCQHQLFDEAEAEVDSPVGEQVDLTEGSVGFQAVEGRLLWRASGYGVI